MLKLKHLFENFELAKHCIGYWEHDAAALDETLRCFRISSNAVYPFRQGEGLCFLRLCPAEEKPLSMAQSEIAVLQRLRQEGFAAMEPVPMRDGRYCALLTTRWGACTACCFRQVAGQPLEDHPATPALIEGYGRCLGQLHRLLRLCEGTGRPTHREWLAQAAARLTAHRAPAWIGELHRQLARRLEALPRTPESYGLIHYDFEADNVFYHPGSGQYSVIDFDDMIHGWYALDVVRALDGLTDLPQGDAPMSLAMRQQAFLRGYRSSHPFTQEQEASLPLMRQAVCLCEYAGLLRVLDEPVANEPAWMCALRRRLTHRLGELEQALQP